RRVPGRLVRPAAARLGLDRHQDPRGDGRGDRPGAGLRPCARRASRGALVDVRAAAGVRGPPGRRARGAAVSGLDLGFRVASLAAIWFGWQVFRTDSMVRASFSLLASLLAVAVIMVLLLAEYLGLALAFMVATEMTVMALF